MAGTRLSKVSSRLRDDQFFGVLQRRNKRLAGYGWELLQELVQSVAAFQIVEQAFEGYTRACHSRPTTGSALSAPPQSA